MSLPGWKMLLGKSWWQLLTAQERIEWLGQAGDDAQLWMLSGSESKVWCRKEQYCIGTWNVRSMNQGKLDVVKQEMTRVNSDILGISELKWMWIGIFNSDDHYICYCGQEFLRRNGVALIVNKRVWNCISKMPEWSRFIYNANHSTSQ